ncbi:Por secretion system C-terminal sorting domain-containing protein [Algoriphagus aquimarinus]|uniref:Por secretion system C-terminal sorting domain-containing protein n=1 Tax=Algoriphagus aquimarinus TaxID=237018 RepID=A0A1I1BT32_9BACT|nr:Por secretion system C-terminal sorting domain-containing protein [Algoriphagus aquimarinus]
MGSFCLNKVGGILIVLTLCAIVYCSSALGSSIYANSANAIIGNRVSPCGGFLQPSCQPTIFNLSNAESNNGSHARLVASPGIAIGIGAYKSKIELRFDGEVPANTTTYIKIDGDESLLQSLLGGSLGDVLSGVLGSVLLGRQDIIVEARTSSSSVLMRSSITGFDTDRVRLVSDASGDFYIAIKPSSAYDRIRITNQSNSVAGLGSEYELDVHHAFYFEPDPCGGEPVFTSFDGSGLTLDVASLNAQISSLNLAIDDDLDSTFSEISLGVVGVAGTVEQMIYFNSPVQPGNEILISMATGESLLDLGLLNYVELIAYSNGAVVSSTSAASLLDLDVLGLLASDEFFKFPISDAASTIDRIGIRVSSLVGVGLLEGSLQISGVTVAPIRPEIDTIPEEGQFIICEGETVTVTPNNVSGGDLSWYRLESSTEISMGTADAYTTPDDLIPGDYEFLVKSQGASCAGESEPARFKVKVKPIPSAANYNIQPSGEIGIDEEGKYTYYEGVNPVTLNPTLLGWTGEGEFEWYLDETMVIELQDGDLIGEVLYQVDSGKLTMTGLKFRDELDPYKFYLNWVPIEGCGPSEPKEIDLSSIARILNVSLQSFDAHFAGRNEVAVKWDFAIDRLDQRLVVQRAGSDLVFEDIWEGELAKNTENSFFDTNPLFGDSYYRLVVRSLGGELEFVSNLRRVFNSQPIDKSFLVFPNEFEDSFTIGAQFDQAKEISYSLYSGKGSLLKEGSTQIAGQNPFRIAGLESHASGQYFLIIRENDQVHTHHLIKK